MALRKTVGTVVGTAAAVALAFIAYIQLHRTPTVDIAATVTANEFVLPPLQGAQYPAGPASARPGTYLRVNLVNKGTDGATAVAMSFPQPGDTHADIADPLAVFWCVRHEAPPVKCGNEHVIPIDTLLPTATAVVQFWSWKAYTSQDFDAISLRHQHGIGTVRLIQSNESSQSLLDAVAWIAGIIGLLNIASLLSVRKRNNGLEESAAALSGSLVDALIQIVKIDGLPAEARNEAAKLLLEVQRLRSTGKKKDIQK